MSQCKSCGAAISWAKTPSGKLIPLDAGPEGAPAAFPDGGIRFNEWGVAMAIGPTKRDPGESYYRTHFQTCPGAALHRKKKEATDG